HLYAEDGEALILTQEAHRLPPEALKEVGKVPRVIWQGGFAAALVRTPLGLHPSQPSPFGALILDLTQDTAPIDLAQKALRQALLEAFFLLFPLG
ncbi:hypothetical protein LWU35_22205, partial [Enterobacter hormaechei]|nr:hypothetical protein [Enterobacter hormaechei]